MKLVIFGSGATAGTLPDCRVAKEFGQALAKRNGEWRQMYPTLDRVVDHVVDHVVGGSDWDLKIAVNDWDLTEVWTRVDYYSKLSSFLGTTDYGANASYEIRKAILDVYGLSARDQISRALDDGKQFGLLEILEGTDNGDVIASFNWDVIAEVVAERSGRHVVQAPHPRGANELWLIKPHGSVSWRETPAGTGRVDLGPHPNTDPMRAWEVGEQCQPFMLGAVPIKSELIKEAQYGTAVFEVVRAQWSSLVRAIREADKLVVAGYGFPVEDGYGRFLLQEAARQRARPLETIEVHGLGQDRDLLIGRLRDIFGVNPAPVWRGEIADP